MQSGAKTVSEANGVSARFAFYVLRIRNTYTYMCKPTYKYMSKPTYT